MNKSSELELYDISKDPFEKNNLASRYPKIVNELKREIEKSRVASPYYE